MEPTSPPNNFNPNYPNNPPSPPPPRPDPIPPSPGPLPQPVPPPPGGPVPMPPNSPVPPPQPFQPPMSPVQAPTQPSVPPPADYQSNPFLVTIRGLLAVLHNNPVPVLLAGIVGFAVILGAVIVALLLSAILGQGIATVLAFIIYLVGVPVLYGAYIAIGAASAKGERITTNEAFKRAFAKLVSLIVLTIMLLVSIFVGLLLLVIPGIILMARTSLSYIAMFEENLGAIQAVKRSFELTKGHTMEMIGALFAGALMGGQGLLGGAVMVSPIVGRYKDLKQLKASGAPKPKVHWLNYLVLIVMVVYIGLIVLVVAISSKTQNELKTNPVRTPRSNDSFDQFYDDNSDFQFEVN